MKIQETAERRQVTVLHVDIVNSTALVDHLDPEEFMEVMKTYLDNCRAIIDKHHGILAGYTGDGFEAYFGYPAAREEFAIEAVNAAIQVAQMLTERRSQFPFDCRIGIATGRVVIDQPGIRDVGRNVLAFGATPHLAKRLEQSAIPGRILVDSSTMKLCEGRFVFHSIGPMHLKGFNEDFEAWEVGEQLRPGQRFLLSRPAPYVGRRSELQLLISRWEATVAGEGQLVLLHGEPGIGKSRLVYEMQKQIPKDCGAVFQFQCLTEFASTPLHPWIHSVQRFAGFQQGDSIDTRLEKLSAYLSGRLGFPKQIVTLSANLMGLVRTDVAHLIDHSPQLITRLQAALIDYVIALSQRTPVLIQVEDIQWIDASTMNVIQSLGERIEHEKIMLIMTCRPKNVPSFNYTYATSLSLTKLDNNSVLELIGKLTSGSQQVLNETVSEKIRQKSEGNPLYVEHLTKHYIEIAMPDRAVTAITQEDDLVPHVLQGSLMERIDKAGQSKEIAQIASVIGKEFEKDILVGLTDEDPERVQYQLEKLAELKILHCWNHGNRIYYEFCHALVRDAVYSSLLKQTRRRSHLRIAEYFAHGHGTVLNAPAEIIAYHYECGDDHANAFRHWLAAGQHALRTGATEEAASLFAKALKTASSIGEKPDYLDDLALTNLSYGIALNASRGAGSHAIDYFRKAEELSTRKGNTELTIEALAWQFGLHFNIGELAVSKEPSLKMKQLGSSLKHSIAVASGCQGLGMAQFMLGNFVEARAEFEFGLRAGGNEISGVHCFPSMSLSYLAWTLFVLGENLEAEACANRAIESARHESSHAVATALNNCCYVYQCLGSTEKVYRHTEELVEHTRKYGEQMYLRRGIILRGWADCVMNRNEEPVQTMKEHIDFLLQSNEEVELTFMLGILADVQIRYARYSEAQSSLDKALAIARKNQENFYLAELYRLKAKLIKADPVKFLPEEGGNYSAMARQTAEAQHAKAWLDRLSQLEPR
jgi:class 3 adenylate cyclase/tetratricopeptide (TPR) repeat protein